MMFLVAAGGSGTRMLPASKFVNKHLIPIGQGELMIDRPLKFLSAHGIKQAAIVTGTNHASQVMDYVQDGQAYGFELVEYFAQPKPAGISDVLKRVSHRTEEGVLMILGDNYFELSQDSVEDIISGVAHPNHAACWEYDIGDAALASRFGQYILEGVKGRIVEKPPVPVHSRILTGLYYLPSDVFQYVDGLSPSARGELEITSLLQSYLDESRLDVYAVKGEWADLGEWGSLEKFISDRYSNGLEKNRLGCS